MVFIAISIVTIVGLTQLVRYGQLRRMHILVAIMVNYVVAAAVSGLVFFHGASSGEIPVLSGAFPLAVVNGVLYFTHFLLLLASYRLAGLGITTALVSSGYVLPVLLSRLIWDEPMPPTRWVAVALVPVVMFLLRPNKDSGKRMTLKGDAVLVLVVLMGGTVMTIHKAAVVAQVGNQQSLYRFALFTTAALVSVGYVAIRRLPVRPREAKLGLGIGLFNTVGLASTVAGLVAVPAVVFFPVVGCLVIVVNVVLSRVFWKERITPRQIVGIAAALIVVVLTNVGSGAS